MPQVGDIVTVLPPFAESFPGQHVVVNVVTSEDGTTAIYLQGIYGAFDPAYLETTE